MKMEQIQYRYEKTQDGETMTGSGNLLDVVICITRQAQLIHERLKDRDPAAADMFRAALACSFADKDSPVWRGGTAVRDGIDLFIMRKGREG